MNFEISPFSGSSSMDPWKGVEPHSHSVVIDSRDRDPTIYPSPSSYRVELPQTFRNVSSARLVAAEIPGTFYVFSAGRGNTTLTVSVNGVTKTIQIPDGNYTPTAMSETLSSALNAAFSPETFDVSIDETRMQYTITSDPTVTMVVDCRDGAPGVLARHFEFGLGYFLGFTNKVEYTGTGSVSANGSFSLHPETYMLLKIRGLDGVSACSPEGSHEQGRNVFAKIPFRVSSSSINFFDKLLTSNAMNPVIEKIQWLDIELVFHDGTPVTFAGPGEHSFIIEMFTSKNVRKKNVDVEK